MKGIGTLQRQQFYLGAKAQKVCADDKPQYPGYGHWVSNCCVALMFRTGFRVAPPFLAGV